MKLSISLFRQAFFMSFVTLCVGQLLEMKFPRFVTQTVSFDILLVIVMLLGVCWGLTSWHSNHFQAKLHQKT